MILTEIALSGAREERCMTPPLVHQIVLYLKATLPE